MARTCARGVDGVGLAITLNVLTYLEMTSDTKWREISLRQTLQVRITSDTQRIQSSD